MRQLVEIISNNPSWAVPIFTYLLTFMLVWIATLQLKTFPKDEALKTGRTLCLLSLSLLIGLAFDPASQLQKAPNPVGEAFAYLAVFCLLYGVSEVAYNAVIATVFPGFRIGRQAITETVKWILWFLASQLLGVWSLWLTWDLR